MRVPYLNGILSEYSRVLLPVDLESSLDYLGYLMQFKCWVSALSCIVLEIMVRKEILCSAQMVFLPEFLDLQLIKSSDVELSGTEERVCSGVVPLLRVFIPPLGKENYHRENKISCQVAPL